MTEAEKRAVKMIRTGHATEIIDKLEEIELELAAEGQEVPTEFKLGVLMAARVLVPGAGDSALQSFYREHT